MIVIEKSVKSDLLYLCDNIGKKVKNRFTKTMRIASRNLYEKGVEKEIGKKKKMKIVRYENRDAKEIFEAMVLYAYFLLQNTEWAGILDEWTEKKERKDDEDETIETDKLTYRMLETTARFMQNGLEEKLERLTTERDEKVMIKTDNETMIKTMLILGCMTKELKNALSGQSV